MDLNALPKSSRRWVTLIALGVGLAFGGDAWIRRVSAQTTDASIAPVRTEHAANQARIEQALTDLAARLDRIERKLDHAK